MIDEKKLMQEIIGAMADFGYDDSAILYSKPENRPRDFYVTLVQLQGANGMPVQHGAERGTGAAMEFIQNQTGYMSLVEAIIETYGEGKAVLWTGPVVEGDPVVYQANIGRFTVGVYCMRQCDIRGYSAKMQIEHIVNRMKTAQRIARLDSICDTMAKLVANEPKDSMVREESIEVDGTILTVELTDANTSEWLSRAISNLGVEPTSPKAFLGAFSNAVPWMHLDVRWDRFPKALTDNAKGILVQGEDHIVAYILANGRYITLRLILSKEMERRPRITEWQRQFDMVTRSTFEDPHNAYYAFKVGALSFGLGRACEAAQERYEIYRASGTFSHNQNTHGALSFLAQHFNLEALPSMEVFDEFAQGQGVHWLRLPSFENPRFVVAVGDDLETATYFEVLYGHTLDGGTREVIYLDD